MLPPTATNAAIVSSSTTTSLNHQLLGSDEVKAASTSPWLSFDVIDREIQQAEVVPEKLQRLFHSARQVQCWQQTQQKSRKTSTITMRPAAAHRFGRAPNPDAAKTHMQSTMSFAVNIHRNSFA
jgi:hypothetical protein